MDIDVQSEHPFVGPANGLTHIRIPDAGSRQCEYGRETLWPGINGVSEVAEYGGSQAIGLQIVDLDVRLRRFERRKTDIQRNASKLGLLFIPEGIKIFGRRSAAAKSNRRCQMLPLIDAYWSATFVVLLFGESKIGKRLRVQANTPLDQLRIRAEQIREIQFRAFPLIARRVRQKIG